MFQFCFFKFPTWGICLNVVTTLTYTLVPTLNLLWGESFCCLLNGHNVTLWSTIKAQFLGLLCFLQANSFHFDLIVLYLSFRSFYSWLVGICLTQCLKLYRWSIVVNFFIRPHWSYIGMTLASASSSSSEYF